MILRRMVGNLSRRASRILADARYSVGRPVDGRLTWARLVAAYVLPAGVFVVVAVLHPKIAISTFLSGAAVFSGVLVALCTLSFNRVKDLAGDKSEGVWQGADPMRAAYRFARNTLSAAYVSVCVTGLLVAQIFITTGWPARAMLALTIALVAHLGVRIWFLLGGIRHQVEAVAGQRSAERPRRLRNVS